MIVLRESGYVAVPWKNGGGVTREIHREPALSAANSFGAATSVAGSSAIGTAAHAVAASGGAVSTDFDWRLSLATIDSPGPFSRFDDCHRTLTLVRGAGVALTFDQHADAQLSATGDSVQFDGAWQTACRLLDGPSTDLNLIVSKARVEAVSRSIQLPEPEVIDTAGWSQTLVCCILGSVDISNAGGDIVELASVDVVLGSQSDGTLTCRSRGPIPARVFIATIRNR